MSERALRAGSWIYRIGAVSNFVVTIPAFVAYNVYIDRFFEVRPTYPFLVWIWSGMAFLWGVMFWEISRDVVGKYPLIKYSYLEKGVTTASAAVAYAIGDVETGFFLGIIYTDIIWIPLFAWVHLTARRARATAT